MWTPPTGYSNSTYRVYVNTTDTNSGGIEVDETSFTTESLEFGQVLTIHVRATTGTYFSVPATSSSLTVRGKSLR